MKFAAKGTRSTLNIKETVSTSKDGSWNIDDDVKLWFDLNNNQALYARVKSTNYIKLHYDHGLTVWQDNVWNLYSSFWTDKSLSKSSVRLGFASIHPRCTSDNRLRVNTALGAHTFYYYNRTLSYFNQNKLGIVAVIDLTNKVLQKNNVLLGHVFNERHETFLRLQNDGFRLANPNFSDVKSIWDHLTLDYVGRLNQTTKLGIQVSFFYIQATVSLRDESLRKVEATVEKILPEQAIVLKAKVNNHHDFAFLFKRAMWGVEDLVTLSTGFGVKNALSDKRSPHYGIQLDFNI